MIKLGYALSSAEHEPGKLVANAQMAENAVEAMGDPKIPEDSILGPNPNSYLKAIKSSQENGYDHVYIHQVGPDQEGFLKFFKTELLPLLGKEELAAEIT